MCSACLMEPLIVIDAAGSAHSVNITLKTSNYQTDC
jgi:hypothetical protein